ncbi:MAG TPA: hypothetical protein VJH03_25155 [Blastocatellia bacterium]|nr:hypothetical protein [Blastocatellia bacterium]
MIAPIGESASETRKRSDIVLKYVISPAAEQCGYATLRADQIAEPGLITSQVIQHIIEDPFVIADLSERNPNVFYELAIRHALRKPLVQIIKNDEQIPFDVAGTRTIPVDHKDLESVEIAKQEIVKQIESLEKKPQEIETPISVAIELQYLRKSDNPEERSLAEILSSLSEIKTELSNMQKSQTSVGDQREMAMMTDRLMYISSKMDKELSYRFEEMFDRQGAFLEELKTTLSKNVVNISPKERKA